MPRRIHRTVASAVPEGANIHGADIAEAWFADVRLVSITDGVSVSACRGVWYAVHEHVGSVLLFDEVECVVEFGRGRSGFVPQGVPVHLDGLVELGVFGGASPPPF